MGHTPTRPRDGLRECRAAGRRAGESINATRIRNGYATARREQTREPTHTAGPTDERTRRTPMTDSDLKAAKTLSTRASKSLDAMRAKIARADEARSDAAQQARAAHVVDAARRAVTENRAAVETWDALATHAATQASDCRRGGSVGRSHPAALGTLGSGGGRRCPAPCPRSRSVRPSTSQCAASSLPTPDSQRQHNMGQCPISIQVFFPYAP